MLRIADDFFCFFRPFGFLGSFFVIIVWQTISMEINAFFITSTKFESLGGNGRVADFVKCSEYFVKNMIKNYYAEKSSIYSKHFFPRLTNDHKCVIFSTF